MSLFLSRINELSAILDEFAVNCSEPILQSANAITEIFNSGGKLLICGNGGSAADSQHFAAEFVSSFAKGLERRALPAISLTVDSSILTAYSNDFGFENVFARQVEALGNPKDMLIVLTTSGKSNNCILAVEKARDLGLKTLAFSKKESNISQMVDYSIEVPSDNTQHIQECHLVAYHVITEIVENSITKEIREQKK
jgi:D-sedoheptulose 7-phosphate isomerase